MSQTKRRMVLRFPADSVNEPITYTLIKEYDVIINILNADITHGKEGNLLIEMIGLKGRRLCSSLKASTLKSCPL